MKKNQEAFDRRGDVYTYPSGVQHEVIYEVNDFKYTYSDLNRICKNTKTTNFVWNQLDGQLPETVMLELIEDGEIDKNGELFFTSFENQKLKDKVIRVNNSFGKLVIWNERNGVRTKAKIASDVHPYTGNVGLDLMDGFPLTLIVSIHSIEI